MAWALILKGLGLQSHLSSSASQNIPVSILCKTSEVWWPCFGNRLKHSKRAKDWLRFMVEVHACCMTLLRCSF